MSLMTFWKRKLKSSIVNDKNGLNLENFHFRWKRVSLRVCLLYISVNELGMFSREILPTGKLKPQCELENICWKYCRLKTPNDSSEFRIFITIYHLSLINSVFCFAWYSSSSSSFSIWFEWKLSLFLLFNNKIPNLAQKLLQIDACPDSRENVLITVWK